MTPEELAMIEQLTEAIRELTSEVRQLITVMRTS